MDKVSFDLPQTKWGTIKSKYKPETRYVTSDEFTVGSYNFITNIDGSLTKRPTDVLYNPTPLAAVGKDQFEAIFSSGTHHFLSVVSGTLKYSTGDGIVTTAKTGYTANANMEYTMYQNRAYFCNGVDNPGVYDLTTSYGGVSYTFPTDTIKSMGCAAPSSAATFNADSSGGSVPAGGHIYKVTFLYYGLEESNGGTASALHTVSASNFTVNLKTIPVGGYGVTARKIYRDNNDGNFLLVGTISDNTTTTFVDTVSAGTTAIPTANNLPPVFSYIALNLSRLWVAGISGTPTTLYWSLPGLPDIFDPNNFILCNPKDPIQAVYVYQGVTYILNRHSFGRITGTTDDNFAYEEFPGSVGCVDNRSLQVRTINGVPTLIWLSDRGFYAFNGSSADYISDPIEDLVNLNIQQVNFVTGSNNQSSLADFQAGTASAGIDLLANPGVITTLPTSTSFQSESDWEGGSSLTNVSTADGSNQLKVPTRFTTSLAAGSLGGNAVLSSVFVTLPTISDNTGLATSNTGHAADVVVTGMGSGNTSGPDSCAQSVTFPFAGVINSFTVNFIANIVNGTPTVTGYIWTKTALNQPGTIIWQSSPVSIAQGDPVSFSHTFSPGVSVAAGDYIFGFQMDNGGVRTVYTINTGSITSGSVPSCGAICANLHAQGTSPVVNWGPCLDNFGGPHVNAFNWQLSFTQTAVSSSGTWASPVFDSYSTGSAVAASVVNSASYPTSCSATLFVDESNDATMSTGVTTFSQADPDGTYSPGISGKRYWRMRYSLSTTDNRRAPSLEVPRLTFSTTGTWISPAIDCTTDVTAYNAITITDDVPSGTTVTVTVATSTNNISYSTYGPVGSATVHRYVKVKVVLTTTSDDANTPGVSLLRFSWNLTSTFTSSIINVGQAPSGWGLFQDVATANSGTITFYMRSASSSGGIPGASFVAVTNGAFPDTSILPNQYTQWKVVITTAATGNLPTVESVTVNWFLGNNQSPIRAASLFFDKTYYCSAAETNQTVNNVVIAYDQEGNWRLFRGLNINSMGLFFNQPFYLDAVRPNIYQWLVSPNGLGTAITMDVRTRAFDLGDVQRLKDVRSLLVSGINTGTTLHAYYSVDRGVTWIEMLNSHGATGYVTTTDATKFNEYFVPDYSLGNTICGVTVMFRVTSTDAFPCSILTVKPTLYVRNGKYLGRPL